MQVFDPKTKQCLLKTATVLGYGVTGKATVDFLLKSTNLTLYVGNSGHVSDWAKEVVDRVEFFDLEDKNLLKKNIKNSDFVMRSPGLDPRKFTSLDLVEKEVGEIEIAYQYLDVQCQNKNRPKIIAITGTNGKTTTVSLLDHFLRQNSLKCFLGGNVGTPFVVLFKDQSWQDTQVIVLELSSFQTEQLDTFRADSSAILNLSSSHEERYDDPKDYFKAKINLIHHTDINFFCYLEENFETIVDLDSSIDLSKARKVCLEDELKDKVAESLDLIGDHNILNALFCANLTQLLGLKAELEYFKGFTGVSYRLQKVETNNDRVVYNDAKSTNQEASLIATLSMQSKFKEFHLLMGGQLRDDSIKFDNLFSQFDNAAKLHFFGESRNELKRHADKYKLSCRLYENIESVLDEIREDDLPILFSPGFPSFDQFKNYVERGKYFNTQILKICGSTK